MQLVVETVLTHISCQSMIQNLEPPPLGAPHTVAWSLLAGFACSPLLASHGYTMGLNHHRLAAKLGSSWRSARLRTISGNYLAQGN